jgi:hypothetical protein
MPTATGTPLSSASATFWKNKLAAFLHDSPTKAPDIRFHEQRADAATAASRATALSPTTNEQALSLTELETAEAELRRDATRAQGWAVRVAHDLIEHRKQSATKSVLTPLENRRTTAFAELIGDATRQIFLDDRFQILILPATWTGIEASECSSTFLQYATHLRPYKKPSLH